MLEWVLTFIINFFFFFVLLIIFYFISPIFIKIDTIIINFFIKIKNSIISVFNNFCFFNLNSLPNKNITKCFNNLGKKIYLNLSLNYSEFLNLFKDILDVYKLHKKFILITIRKYIYISILLYIIVWLCMMLSFSNNSIYIFWVTQKFIYLYAVWTYPFRKFRFLIGYLVRFPINIIKLIIYVFFYIWEFFYPKIEPKSIFK